MMKRLFKTAARAVLCLAAALSVSAAAGAPAQAEPLKVVATIFPAYDWVREIMGSEAENAEVTLLLGSGVDMHSFQPTVADIMKVGTADVFIYVGGESDAWVEDALKEAVNKEMVTVDLMEVLADSLKEEEEAGGKEAGGAEYDEHVWLSLRNASVCVAAIADALGRADEEHADVYAKNAAAYQEKLAALDESYIEMAGSSGKDTILFGDRFPFRYLTEDYGIRYYAAFDGCSAESEASFETVIFLANKIDELGLGTILTIEGSDGKLAGTIRDNTETKDQDIAALCSMQNTTLEEAQSGTTYLGVMEQNLEVLRAAMQ